MLDPKRDPSHQADTPAAGSLAIYASLADLRAALLGSMAVAVLDAHRAEVAALFEGRVDR